MIGTTNATGFGGFPVLPKVTSEDNGKILMVVDGKWTLVPFPMLKKLDSPILSIDGSILSITDPSGMAESFSVYADNIYEETVRSHSLDLKNYRLSTGLHTIKVVSSAQGYVPSDASFIEYYESEVRKLPPPLLSLNNNMLYITGQTDIREEMLIYADGISYPLTSIIKEENTMTIRYDLFNLGLSVGNHTIYVQATSDGYISSDKDDAHVTYVVEKRQMGAPTLTINGKTLLIEEGSGSPATATYDIYSSGGTVLKSNISRTGVTTSFNLDSIAALQSPGTTAIYVVAKAEHYEDATSAETDYIRYSIDYRYRGTVLSGYFGYIAAGDTKKITGFTLKTGYSSSDITVTSTAGTVSYDLAQGSTTAYEVTLAMTSQMGDALVLIEAAKGTTATPTNLSITDDTLTFQSSVDTSEGNGYFSIYADSSTSPSKYIDSLGNEVYPITFNLKNCGKANGPIYIVPRSTCDIYFSVLQGYALPESSSVTVSGASFTWTKASGRLDLSNPTGPVYVTISATKK